MKRVITASTKVRSNYGESIREQYISQLLEDNVREIYEIAHESRPDIIADLQEIFLGSINPNATVATSLTVIIKGNDWNTDFRYCPKYSFQEPEKDAEALIAQAQYFINSINNGE